MKNSEGYTGNTAGKAIYQADKLPKPIMDVVHILRLVAGLTGLSIKSVELVDRRTGKKYWWGR